MKNQETIQEGQYSFPYHYLTISNNEDFTLSKSIQWGLMHESYIRLIAKQVTEMQPKKVLDAGCGEGRVLYELEKKLNLTEFVGIDISERALHFARAFTKRSKFLVHDITEKPVIGNFDLCVSIEVIEHIRPEEIPNYIKNIAGSLEIGGRLILTTPTTNIPTSKKHYQHFTKEKLEEYLLPHFEITDVQYQNIENNISKLFSRFLTNKYYTLNYAPLKNFIFKYYGNNFLIGDAKNGTRICLVAKKV